MTIEELIEKLKLIEELNGDEEISHIRADELLLKFINNEEVSKAFDNISKYYA